MDFNNQPKQPPPTSHRASHSLGRLAIRVGENEALEVTGPSGRKYQIEYDIVWDHKPPNGDIRIIGSVDDGGLRAFAPLTDSRLVSPPSR
jgi:hypothetical protein